MYAQIASTLDPSEYTVVPHVGALDTFRMTNDDGDFVADITEAYIDKTIAHMNERESKTGDLCPIVIGHTRKGERETESPPLVGFARNWHKGTLGNTGRPCAFMDAWIRNDKVAAARDFPRRSCEVYVHLHECDPISLLGATTPARDLGLMLLSREGSLTVESPGEMNMPDEKKEEKPKADDKPKADPKETGEAKGVEGKLDMLIGLIQQMMQGQAGAPPAAPGAAGGDNKEMSDEELEKLLGLDSAGGEPPPAAGPSRSGEEKVQNAAGYPGGDNTNVHLSREVEALKVQLARRDIKDALKEFAKTKQVNADDEELITDLAAMPPEIRGRQITRIGAQAQGRLDADPVMLNRALSAAVGSPGGQGKRLGADKDECVRLQRVAAEKKITFEAAAREAGYTL